MRGPRSVGDGSRTWRRLQLAAALSAALLSIVLGLLWLPPETMNPRWPWIEAVQPLERAPIPAGTRLVFAPPPGTPPSEQVFWLYEARWRRPDLLWSTLDGWPLAEPPAFGVVVGLKHLPNEWQEVWRQREVCLARRDEAR